MGVDKKFDNFFSCKGILSQEVSSSLNEFGITGENYTIYLDCV